MGRLFGTDGVRGVANREVTAELALDLSVAAAHVLAVSGAFAGHRPRAVVGRDPRASGEFLSAAVTAGLASAGVDVVDVGVLPTPGVAYLTHALGVDLGVQLRVELGVELSIGICICICIRLDLGLSVRLHLALRVQLAERVGERLHGDECVCSAATRIHSTHESQDENRIAAAIECRNNCRCWDCMLR